MDLYLTCHVSKSTRMHDNLTWHVALSQALASNPKIEVVEGDKYKFRPPYSVRDRKGLLRLLDKHDQRGLGGILLEDIEESLPNAQKALKVNANNATYTGNYRTRCTGAKLAHSAPGCTSELREHL